MSDNNQLCGCFDQFEPEDILNCPNTETDAGLVESSIYYALSCDVQTLEVPPLEGSFEEAGCLSTDIEMKAGKGFGVIQALVDKNNFTGSLTGNKGQKKTSAQLVFYLPGITAKNLGFIRKFKNVPLVCVVKLRSGNKIVVGNLQKPAYFDSVETASGSTDEDEIGSTVTLITGAPLLEYTGSIALLGGGTEEQP